METRQTILEKLRDRLESHSWQTFGPTVFVGRTIFDPDSDPLPVLTIVPGLESSERTRYGADRIDMPCEVSALVSLKDGRDVTELCEPIFAEIKQALFAPGQIEVESGDDPQYVSITYVGGGIADYPGEIGPAIVTIVVQVRLHFEQYIEQNGG